MFCKNCGTRLGDESICPNCGYYDKSNAPVPAYIPNTEERAGCLLALISFIIPLSGLVLYFIWKDTYPLKARTCKRAAFTSLIITIIFYCIYAALLSMYYSRTGGSPVDAANIAKGLVIPVNSLFALI